MEACPNFHSCDYNPHELCSFCESKCVISSPNNQYLLSLHSFLIENYGRQKFFWLLPLIHYYYPACADEIYSNALIVVFTSYIYGMPLLMGYLWNDYGMPKNNCPKSSSILPVF